MVTVHPVEDVNEDVRLPHLATFKPRNPQPSNPPTQCVRYTNFNKYPPLTIVAPQGIFGDFSTGRYDLGRNWGVLSDLFCKTHHFSPPRGILG